MRRKRGVYAGLMAAAGLAVALVWSSGHAQAPAAAAKYAVVDLERVLDQSQQSVDVQKMLADRAKQVQTELETRARAVQTKQADLTALHPDSPEAYKLEEEIDRLDVEHETIQKVDQAQLAQERNLWVAEGYKQAMTAIQQIAQDRGLDLVLFQDRFDPKASPDDLIARMAARKVLYAREYLDVTDEVLKLMNQQYQQRGGAASIKIGL
jgi:Skp family chaperone for outer membrane proteins